MWLMPRCCQGAGQPISLLDDDLTSKEERWNKTKAQKMPGRPECQAVTDKRKFHRDQVYKAVGAEAWKGISQWTSIWQDPFKNASALWHRQDLP